jgi:hypothetical protein
VRARGILAAALVTGALALAAPAFAVDRGKDRPPTTLTSDFQAIWMTEWSACWTSSLSRISRALHIPVKSGMTPQQAAKKLSKRAVKFLYETREELSAGADGCRNGILWRYYHPPG